MKNLGGIIALVILFGALAAYHFSDGQTHKRQLRAALETFKEAVATKDRAQMALALQDFIAHESKITLKVNFFAITGGSPAITQEMDKPQFIAFIDNTLFPLSDYSYNPTLTSFDEETGEVIFTSAEWGDGKDMMGGVGIEMRYSSNTECKGKAIFENDKAQLAGATCEVQFRKVPKPGQADKISQQGLQDLLRR
jgi:hypothetical protein